MKRLGIAAVGLAVVLGVSTAALTGCASEQVVEKLVLVTPTVAPAPTPEPKPAITLADAPSYLNVSDILPGFKRLDPSQEGMTWDQPWAQQFGKEAEKFSDFQLYLSDQPYQYVFMTMGVFSGESEQAAWKAMMRGDDQGLTQQFLSGFAPAFAASSGQKEAPKVSVVWSDVAVGDSAKRAQVSLSYQGGRVQMVDMVIMFQENSVTFIYDLWYPAEPAAVDILTVARAVSGRIANR